jgi:prophage regulatory protein
LTAPARDGHAEAVGTQGVPEENDTPAARRTRGWSKEDLLSDQTCASWRDGRLLGQVSIFASLASQGAQFCPGHRSEYAKHVAEEIGVANKERIVRMKTVLERTALSRATIYRKIADGTFPRQVKISVHGAGWHESDIDRWIANPPAFRAANDNDRIGAKTDADNQNITSAEDGGPVAANDNLASLPNRVSRG